MGLSLKIADTSFLFINSHLAAHQGAVAERNRDFKTICSGLPLPHQDHLEQAFQLISTSVRRNRNVTEMFDRVFWMGDLNYRIEVTRAEADKRITSGDYISLLKYDDLGLEAGVHTAGGFHSATTGAHACASSTSPPREGIRKYGSWPNGVAQTETANVSVFQARSALVGAAGRQGLCELH